MSEPEIRQVIPAPGGPSEPIDIAVAIATERRDHHDGRPWVFTNMVTTIDGAATLDGVSSGLGGPADRAVFSALRSEADVIVVGAQTVRDEQYRLPRAPGATAAAARRARGQAGRPRLCIVTRGDDLGGAPPLVDELPNAGEATAEWQRPIIGTVSASRATRTFDERFDIVEAGDDSVDLHRLVRALGELGLQRVLCEGGPSLLAQLATDDVVDEWNFTVAPLVAAGDSVRPVHSSTSSGTRLRLERAFVADDSTIFTRYLTDRRD